MRGTFVFVHGTGVRKAGYDATCTAIREKVSQHGFAGVTFTGCLWGDPLGTKTDRVGDTLPPDIQTRAALDKVSAAEIEAATWALLRDDPLFELRVAAEMPPRSSTGVSVGTLSPDQVAVTAVLGLKAASLDLTGTGLTPADVERAADFVAASQELRGAASVAGKASDGDLVRAEARAVVAAILADHRADPPGTAPTVSLQGTVRDAFVKRVEEALEPLSTRGVVMDWIKGKIVDFAKRRASAYVLERRESITGMSLPAIGDILLYQRRGDDIRRLIATTLQNATPPVVAVGHSLGGIMLVDLLSAPGAPKVDLLVTVGSQAPVLFAIDALGTLRPGGAAQPYVPWLNIYDRTDILSYCAARIFTNTNIIDEAVDSGVPFPDSHSAYWTNDAVYRLIQTHWPRGTP